jgi:hypothetical protein
MDTLAMTLRETPGRADHHLAGRDHALHHRGMAEGSGKWLTLSRDQAITNAVWARP